MKTIFYFLTIAALFILTISVSAQEDILFQVVPSDYTSTPAHQVMHHLQVNWPTPREHISF
jgi:hypothetical protein